MAVCVCVCVCVCHQEFTSHLSGQEKDTEMQRLRQQLTKIEGERYVYQPPLTWGVMAWFIGVLALASVLVPVLLHTRGEGVARCSIVRFWNVLGGVGVMFWAGWKCGTSGLNLWW